MMRRSGPVLRAFRYLERNKLRLWLYMLLLAGVFIGGMLCRMGIAIGGLLSPRNYYLVYQTQTDIIQMLFCALLPFSFLLIIFFSGTNTFGYLTAPLPLLWWGTVSGASIARAYLSFDAWGILIAAALLLPRALLVSAALAESCRRAMRLSMHLTAAASGQTEDELKNLFRCYPISFLPSVLMIVLAAATDWIGRWVYLQII